MIFKQTVEKIFTYVLRDLTSPEGGFYSAEDADSEGEEGRFLRVDTKRDKNGFRTRTRGTFLPFL